MQPGLQWAHLKAFSNAVIQPSQLLINDLAFGGLGEPDTLHCADLRVEIPPQRNVAGVSPGKLLPNSSGEQLMKPGGL